MKRFRFCLRLLAFFALAIFLSTPALAQFRSSIEGTVTDPAGAVVPGAQVTLTNVDTGISQTAPTNAEGLFRFLSLPPGNFKLTATKPGFATVSEEHIVLLGSEVRTVALVLKAGEVRETVTVTAESTPIQLAESKIAGDISAKEIAQLPLAGRNIGNLISQIPGVTGVGNASRNASDTDVFTLVNNPQNNGGGQRAEANAFYVDNTLATSNPDPGTYNLVPNPESIQELHVALNDYSAEYGRQGSLVVQAITKGGTNQFHGSLFEYHEDNKLTAANFSDAGTVPVYRRNEFGGSLGGPIRKNKMFGFFSWDQKRASKPTSSTPLVEHPDFVNFMKTNFPNNLSTKLMTAFPPTITRVAAGSVQTVNDIMGVDDETGVPLCVENGPPVPGMPCDLNIREQAINDVAGVDNGLQWNFRIDLTYTKDRFYGSFFRKTPDVEGINTRPAFTTHNDFAGTTNYANLNWTHTFSPTMINEAAMGITRISGFGSCQNCQVQSMFNTGIALFGASNGFSPAKFIQNDFEWRDVLSFNHGRHAWKAGADIFRDQENDLFDGPTQRPGYVFFGTSVPGIFNFANDKPQLEPGINFDLRTGELSRQSIGYRSTAYGFFVQDDWKLKPNFSLNLGLRWDFNSNPNEQSGQLSTILFNSGTALMDKIAGASVGIVPNVIKNHKIAYFAPRLSFAWDPTKQGKLSIRGGIGVFYERMPNIFWSDANRANPPFIAGVTADSTKPVCTNPALGIPAGCAPQPVYGLCALDKSPFNCPIPPVSQLPTGLNARGGSIACCSDIGGVDPDVKQAYTISRFAGVQYSFTPNWMLEVNYTGSQSVHQYVQTDRNRCVGCYTVVGTDSPDTTAINAVRPNAFFNAIRYGDNSGWAHYNGATFSVLHRFSQSFTFQGAFTIGKTTSVVDAPGPGRDSLLAPVFDTYNINAQAGPASFDIPRAFTMHGLWELPKLSAQNAAVRGVLGSWQLSGTASLQGGYPYTVVDCNHSIDGGQSCVLPNAVTSETGKSCDRSGWVAGCLSASAFANSDPCLILNINRDPTPTTPGYFVHDVLSSNSTTFAPCTQEGNVGRNSFRGPGYADVDMSLAKYFHIPWFTNKEGARLQVRGEFFNLFNRVNLHNVSSDLSLNPGGGSTNTSFGRALDAYFPRTIQLAVRIEF
jgi:hypothetical protein